MVVDVCVRAKATGEGGEPKKQRRAPDGKKTVFKETQKFSYWSGREKRGSVVCSNMAVLGATYGEKDAGRVFFLDGIGGYVCCCCCCCLLRLFADVWKL